MITTKITNYSDKQKAIERLSEVLIDDVFIYLAKLKDKDVGNKPISKEDKIKLLEYVAGWH